MKDNISLIAAAAGGFMLSMALTGILHGSPVTVLTKQVRVGTLTISVIAQTEDSQEDAIANSGFSQTVTG